MTQSIQSPKRCAQKKDGSEYNFTFRFGPLRDQNGHGLCSPFQIAGLLEEHICLTLNRCGESLSPLDVSVHQFTLGKGLFDEGSNALELLEHALDDGGVCLEKHAPFHSKMRPLMCRLLDFTLPFSLGESCITRKIFVAF